MTNLIKCIATRYRYKAERDCLEITSPSKKTITLKLMSCKKWFKYWEFSDIIQKADGLGEFTTDWKKVEIFLTKEQMLDFLLLSKQK